MSGDLGVSPLVETWGDAPRRTDRLDALFAPRGVVVVGASRDPDKLGGAMAASLGGYADAGGDVVLVNARGAVGMCATVAEAASAISTIDLAVLCIPAEVCADTVAECAEAGVGAALVCAGGFGEVGEKGLAHEHRLHDVAAEHGVRLLGPNTSGFFVPRHGLRASFVPGAASLVAGPVAVVAASGGLNHALAFALQRQGCGVSLGVGIGAGLDVAAPEVLEYLAEDPDTRSVALHIETVADGPRLLAAVRALTRTTPVVALVVGQHDIGDFARSHTGALATSWRTTRSLLREAGAVVVDDEEQLVTAASVLARVRLTAHPDPGVALVTAQAGPGLLVTDALHGAGLRLPGLTVATRERLSSFLPPMTFQANPVDTGRPGPNHGHVLAAVAADPGVDLIAVYGLTEPVIDLPSEVARADLGGVPAVVGLDGLAEEVSLGRDTANRVGVAAVVGARALATAITALVQDARRQAVIGTDQPAEVTSLHYAGGETHPQAASGGDTVRLQGGPWTEGQAKDVLDLIGIATPARVRCATDEEVRSAADLLGWPVAAKLSDAEVLHKSEVGGVHLGLRDHEALHRAVTALRGLGAREILVEAMAPAGVDLVVGARRDPVFGPVIVLGIGGIATEVYADVAIAALPSTAAQLASLGDDLQAQALLDGFRGDPVVDRVELAEVCARLGALLTANPQLAEVEVNPLRATTGGLLALDAVLVERDPHTNVTTGEETL